MTSVAPKIIDTGAGVLIRALEPREGVQYMSENRAGKINKVISTSANLAVSSNPNTVRNLCNGPAKLCQALGLNRENANMLDLVTEDKVFIELTGKSMQEIHETTRIGIDYAGKEWQDKLWRFYLKGNRFVSKK